jgi:hypothetical protein
MQVEKASLPAPVETGQSPTAPYPFDAPAIDQSLVSRQEIEMGCRKKKVLSILAASSLVGLAFVATKPALALAEAQGNGILFCQRFTGSEYTSVTVDSYQKGRPAQHAFKISHLDPEGCSDPGDYYWTGTLLLTWAESVSGEWSRQQTTCDIPSGINTDRKILCNPHTP